MSVEKGVEVIKHSAHAAVPISYTKFYPVMDDPLQTAGLVVLGLQGIYWIVKIVLEWRKRNEKQGNKGGSSSNSSGCESNGA